MVYSGTNNGETLSWGDNSVVSLDGKTNLDPLISSGVKHIGYNHTRNSFSVFIASSPTQFYKTDNALNLQYAIGVNSSVDVATAGDNCYTLSSTGYVAEYNSGGTFLTGAAQLSGYTRMIYTDNYNSTFGSAIIGINATGFVVLNSTNLLPMYTGNFSTLYGISGVVDMTVWNGQSYILDSSNDIFVADNNRNVVLTEYLSVSIGGATPKFISTNGYEFYISAADSNIYLVRFPYQYVVTRATSSTGAYSTIATISGTGFSDNVGDSSVP